MSDDIRDEAPPRYRVVVNAQGQYSIWPADAEPPAGWSPGGVEGVKDDCLRHIEEVWVDMRPAEPRRAGSTTAPDESLEVSDRDHFVDGRTSGGR
ncbi:MULTISPECIES: MbtH family protein [Streptomyces]|uniref:MbtH family NRPS accessory protein n=1 Tax=Streptomyces cyaneofuscatus TaxID=66883 RepID=A0ABZ1F470_9ACTN|nr:MbtH family NRPS accessory protein [Streptomyces cyaneofuscatus]WSB11216.1 MbtH family NRPS accessory protein [Streptomyces cyaneofuscatus]WSD45251.1 MbtH family NRPS accessory protein [Streptomyces cyaneofuscatus]WTA88445.1 MbtH family NRPS accessory protein [Streptomyces cyaneofuscatus]